MKSKDELVVHMKRKDSSSSNVMGKGVCGQRGNMFGIP